MLLSVLFKRGNIETIQRVADRFSNSRYISTRIFQLSVQYGLIHMVNVLISNTRVDIHDDNEYALRVAVKKGYYDIVKILINHGADVNILDGVCGRYTIYRNNLSMLKLLVSNGLLIEQDKFLVYQAITNRSDNIEIIKYLLNHDNCIENDDMLIRAIVRSERCDILTWLSRTSLEIYDKLDYMIECAIKYERNNIMALLLQIQNVDMMN